MKARVFKELFFTAFIFVISMFTLDFSMQSGLSVSVQSAEARDGHFNRSGHGYHHRGHGGHHYRGHRGWHHGNYGSYYHYGNYYRYGVPIGVGGAIVIGTFFSTLPRNCYKEYAYGRVYYRCGPNYYRRSGNGYIVVEAP